MAIDQSKMAAFVNDGAPPPEGGEVPEGEEMPEEGGQEKFAKLIPLLEEFAEDVQESSDEMDVDVLTDDSIELEPDDMAILQEGYGSLDRRLKKEMEACCGGMSMEDGMYLAEHLETEGLIDDKERVGGWLFRVGEMLGPGETPEDEPEGGDEDDDLPDPEDLIDEV